MATPTKVHPLRRGLLVLALVLYSAVLLFGATPDELSPRVVHAQQKALHETLLGIRFRPFAFVFEGRRGRWKRRSVVLAMHGRALGGEPRLLVAAPTHRMQGYRWLQPAEEAIILKKFQYAGGNRLMRTVADGTRRMLIHRLRRAGYMKQLGRFGCRSAYAGDGEIDRVYLSVAYDAINYETGQIRDFAHVVHIYDCRIDRPLTGGRWTAAEVGEDGVPRPALGTIDPLLSGAKPGHRTRQRARSARVRRARRKRAREASPEKTPGTMRAPASESSKRVKPIRPIGPFGPARESARRLEVGER